MSVNFTAADYAAERGLLSAACMILLVFDSLGVTMVAALCSLQKTADSSLSLGMTKRLLENKFSIR